MYSILFNVYVFWGPNPNYLTKYIAIDRLQLFFDYQKKKKKFCYFRPHFYDNKNTFVKHIFQK
jgi:hypothetical protein